MNSELKQAMDAHLVKTVTTSPGLPGVVAMITDRDGDIYRGSAGTRAIGGGDEMTLDTVFALYSTTKAVTAVAALQLIEDGLLDLDTPARTYLPEIGDLKVLEGFGADGHPILRRPAREITTRMLLTHTAGLAYDFFSGDYVRFMQATGTPSPFSGRRAALNTPLLFEPGERWHYGSNIDWCGQIVEAIAGQRLGEVFEKRIFTPLGMHDTNFRLHKGLQPRLATLHDRHADGSLTRSAFSLPAEPEVDMGGHGLFGTVGDYMKFIRMWLNQGRGDHGRVLKPETVALALSNQMGDLKVQPMQGMVPALANDAEFFPGMPKSWGYSFMINDEDTPMGRPAGAAAWAGLANLFYWIDHRNGFGGFWATQIIPLGDLTSIVGFFEMEALFNHGFASRLHGASMA
jgi:methyl acetate hydrolase